MPLPRQRYCKRRFARTGYAIILKVHFGRHTIVIYGAFDQSKCKLRKWAWRLVMHSHAAVIQPFGVKAWQLCRWVQFKYFNMDLVFNALQKIEQIIVLIKKGLILCAESWDQKFAVRPHQRRDRRTRFRTKAVTKSSIS